MARKPQYTSNVVYVFLIWGSHYYIGAHTTSYKRGYLCLSDIIQGSGNPVSRGFHFSHITKNELKENIEVLFIENYNSKEEALQREENLIKEYKTLYGSLCLNKVLYSNGNGSKGIPCSEEKKSKISKAKKGHNYGESCFSKISQAHGGRPIQQIDLKTGLVLTEYSHIGKAERETGINHIGQACRGERKSAGGYGWRFK